ncbi:hypothetical protein [Flavobacterium endophyticum]|uniref:hypothetical protein n=1 Tax=Flavobacterium endophyticum TaxID=1540163 RepID=UPI0011C435CA|nr:hypothetical protein [Flavobacterium endophyticum]
MDRTIEVTQVRILHRARFGLTVAVAFADYQSVSKSRIALKNNATKEKEPVSISNSRMQCLGSCTFDRACEHGSVFWTIGFSFWLDKRFHLLDFFWKWTETDPD